MAGTNTEGQLYGINNPCHMKLKNTIDKKTKQLRTAWMVSTWIDRNTWQRLGLISSIIALLVSLSGCTPITYMSAGVRKQLDASQFDMKGAKFYTGLKVRVSNEEYLQKSASSENGEVTSNASTMLHKLIITPQVPGKLVKINGDTLFITFDKSSDYYIPFTPDKDGYYSISGLTEWTKKAIIGRYGNTVWTSTIRYGGTLCRVETIWSVGGHAPVSELVIAGRIKSKRVAKTKKKATGAW
jgi:hypothetical protein